MNRGLVTFALGPREYATPLTSIREVVRLDRGSLVDLPGMEPPLAGVLELRGCSLPVLDLRARPGLGAAEGAVPGGRGDVMVLERGQSDAQGSVGVAVDRVRAVVEPEELPPAGAGAENGVLPPYVREVLRGRTGPVFLVDLEQMIDAVRPVRQT